MARILVLNIGAHGHLNPTLPIVEDLVARGEEVTYAAPFEAEAAIRATGATFLGYETTIGKRPGAIPVPGDLRAFKFPLMVLDELAHVFPALEARARAFAPDVILYDFMAATGRALAESLRVPYVRLYPSYAGNETWSLMTAAKAFGMSFDPSIVAEIQAKAAEVSARFGLTSISFPGMMTTPANLNIVFMPRAFQPHGDSFDARFVFVGPSIKARPGSVDFPLDALDREGAPILFISLGTVFNDWPAFFDMCFEAFGGAPWRVVLSTGERVDASVLARAPSNFLARRHVPQLEVLKRAQVFLTHGGMNSTQEAIAFGVPLVVIPQMPEQAITARRVEELGLGLALAREAATPRSLAAAVARVSTEPSFREEASRMQDHARRAGGYRRAAQALLDFARAGV